MVEPSSSVQVSTTGPDSCALNLNWMYGFAETAVSKSAANTCLPATVQVNLFKILRGMMLPLASLRCPVSMTWDTSALTSTRSPFLASFLSSLMRGLTAIAVSSMPLRRSAAAAADRDLDLLARHEERAVVHLGDRDHVLRCGEPDTRVGLGHAAGRREMERHHAGARIFICHNQHVGDVRGFGHRAFDRHRHRHGVAVLGDLRHVELDLAFGRRLAAGEFLDRLVGVILGARSGRAEQNRAGYACADRQRLAP